MTYRIIPQLFNANMWITATAPKGASLAVQTLQPTENNLNSRRCNSECWTFQHFFPKRNSPLGIRHSQTTANLTFIYQRSQYISTLLPIGLVCSFSVLICGLQLTREVHRSIRLHNRHGWQQEGIMWLASSMWSDPLILSQVANHFSCDWIDSVSELIHF